MFIKSAIISLMIKLSLLLALGLISCNTRTNQSYVLAPFEELDTISTNDWWNRGPNDIIDVDVPRDRVIAFGIYTVSRGVIKLTAQLFPLYPKESRAVTLKILRDDEWIEIAQKEVNEIGWATTFRIENLDTDKSYPYKITHESGSFFEGIIRAEPLDKSEITVAALSCNSNQDRGPRSNYVKNINALDPDLVFFAGDQSYDHKEHTAAWLKFGIQFREIFRNRPCVTIPDDHDIGQGNLWGEGGIKADIVQGNGGGYFYDVEYVKMVERAQTAHLPDPYHTELIGQGLSTYYTNYVLGGLDIAIIEDRKFKSGPRDKIPPQGPRPDHVTNPDYDPKSIDLPELKLLGESQLEFLNQWAENKISETASIKTVFSATGFCGAAHLHGSENNRLHADLDSNGWPQSKRNKALSLIRKAGAVHIAGDQHLPTVVHHGIEKFEDGPWALVVPAIINNYYSRWWYPLEPSANKPKDSPLPWTGDFLDGLGNKITMHAYANPDASSNGSGFGFIRFNLNEQVVVFECWPRNEDVKRPDAKQFPGWPIRVSTKTNSKVTKGLHQ